MFQAHPVVSCPALESAIFHKSPDSSQGRGRLETKAPALTVGVRVAPGLSLLTGPSEQQGPCVFRWTRTSAHIRLQFSGNLLKSRSSHQSNPPWFMRVVSFPFLIPFLAVSGPHPQYLIIWSGFLLVTSPVAPAPTHASPPSHLDWDPHIGLSPLLSLPGLCPLHPILPRPVPGHLFCR